MDAVNAPVRRPREEMHTGDVAIEQRPLVRSREDLDQEVVVAPESVLSGDYAAQLKFGEDPVTIRIERGQGKFAPPMVDCWCNGKGAEVLINGRWVSLGYLPVGLEITTKRKYVEILARSKTDSVKTKVVKHEDHEDNLVDRYTSSYAPFSVIEDANPRGAAWLTALVRFN